MSEHVEDLNAMLSWSGEEPPVKVVYSDLKGKHVVAAKAMVAETGVLDEAPLLAWPSSELYDKNFCGRCLMLETPTEPFELCSKCNVEKFCPACVGRVQLVHDILCPSLAAIRSHPKSKLSNDNFSPITLETLCRVVAHITHRVDQIAKVNDLTNAQAAPHAMVPWRRLVALPEGVVIEGLDMATVASIVQGLIGPQVQQVIGEELSTHLLSEETLEDLLGRVVLNAHACPGGAAVYSILSNMNHSCVPNCVVHHPQVGPGENADVHVKLISNVHADEELCIAYVPPEMSDAERRDALKSTYLFDCTCVKCVP
eukprot:PhM_4_TR3314/c0_g1_i1/m.80355/K11426/SMYD; SET and MYND domain-containing protein